jgi:lysophospholipase L1-like esterase
LSPKPPAKAPRAWTSRSSAAEKDVWRGFQGRISEAVDPGEFETNYREMLRLLTSAARHVICIGETPFGWEPSIDVHAANTELQDYNTLAAKAAADAGAQFVDPFRAFTSTARQLTAGTPATRPETALWSDGIHLSELGDTLLFQIVERHLSDTGLIQALTRYDVRERTEALATYRHLFAAVRA